MIPQPPLQAGDRHFRAYVGPPEQYDFMGLTQLALLYALGLREQHRVLDVGCGSLRAGRLLIPFLERGHYYGIEPERWLLWQGLWRNLGLEGYLRKWPRFSRRTDFNYGVFSTRFDFIVAQSILSHTQLDLARRCLAGVKAALTDDGLFVGTFLLPPQAEAGRVDLPGSEWVYPASLGYSEAVIDQLFKEAGLSYWRLGWFHPRQTWYAASRSADRPLFYPKGNKAFPGSIDGRDLI